MRMTLDEAIRHAEEMGRDRDRCGSEHRQLAAWLKELKRLRASKLKEKHWKEDNGR